MIECRLALDRKFNLAAAYEFGLPASFANAETDRDLLAFVRAWGPLYIPNSPIFPGGIPPGGVVSLPLQIVRERQRWIRAFVKLLSAFRSAERERESLLEFLHADNPSREETPTFVMLRNRFHISGDIGDWVTGADLRAVPEFTDCIVSSALVYPIDVHLSCRRERRRRYVEAGWTFSNLEEALRWAIWQGEFTKRPIVSCKGCPKVFRVDSGHTRKYCTPECAHRASAREWQRGYNKRKRRERKQRAGRK